jgi:hypothetical protein
LQAATPAPRSRLRRGWPSRSTHTAAASPPAPAPTPGAHRHLVEPFLPLCCVLNGVAALWGTMARLGRADTVSCGGRAQHAPRERDAPGGPRLAARHLRPAEEVGAAETSDDRSCTLDRKHCPVEQAQTTGRFKLSCFPISQCIKLSTNGCACSKCTEAEQYSIRQSECIIYLERFYCAATEITPVPTEPSPPPQNALIMSGPGSLPTDLGSGSAEEMKITCARSPYQSAFQITIFAAVPSTPSTLKIRPSH